MTIDWAKHQETLREFAENETKTTCVPLRKFDWIKRSRARAWGFSMPLLVGDIDMLSDGICVSVVDNFGNWVGATCITYAS